MSGWQVVTWLGGRRIVCATCSTRMLAELVRLHCYFRDFRMALGLLLRTGVETVPLRFVVECWRDD